MTALSVFGLCAALVVVLLWIVYLALGENSALLMIIFPAIAAESITGERGLDFNHKSFFYLGLLWLFIATEILAVAAIFFGIYCFFWGYPAGVASTAIKTFTVAELSSLLLLNKILLALESYFVCMFTYNSFKHREGFKNLKGWRYFLYRVLPVISFPVGFVFLIRTHFYLSGYPSETLTLWVRAAGYLYAVYLLYQLIRTLYVFSSVRRHGLSQLKSPYWISFALGLFYNGLFLYFFWQLHPVIAFHWN